MMVGIATLTMLVSTICMRVPSMTATRMTIRTDAEYVSYSACTEA